MPEGLEITIPGARVTDLLDASPSGVRLLTSSPLRPGRTIRLRRRPAAGEAEQMVGGLIVRCRVHRITRQGVLYEAALSVCEPPSGPMGV
jgi:hypothetical protein